MDMECLITLDDAVAALHAQLNAPSRRFAALISSWHVLNHVVAKVTVIKMAKFTRTVCLYLCTCS